MLLKLSIKKVIAFVEIFCLTYSIHFRCLTSHRLLHLWKIHRKQPCNLMPNKELAQRLTFVLLKFKNWQKWICKLQFAHRKFNYRSHSCTAVFAPSYSGCLRRLRCSVGSSVAQLHNIHILFWRLNFHFNPKSKCFYGLNRILEKKTIFNDGASEQD